MLLWRIKVNSIEYMKKSFNGLPKGLMVVRCEPTSTHLFAKALVKGVLGTYVRPVGTTGDNNVTFISDTSVLASQHPDIVTRVHHLGAMKIDVDRLNIDNNPKGYRVNMYSHYPFVLTAICVDDRTELVTGTVADVMNEITDLLKNKHVDKFTNTCLTEDIFIPADTLSVYEEMLIGSKLFK